MKNRPEKWMKAFGEIAHAAREKRGWSQAEAAVIYNVTQSTVSRWELGHSLPDILNVCQWLTTHSLTHEQLIALVDALQDEIERRNKITASVNSKIKDIMEVVK